MQELDPRYILLTRGEKVKVISTRHTHPAYSVTAEMELMVGKIYKIEYRNDEMIQLNDGNNSWNWHILDVEPLHRQKIDLSKKYDVVKFDVKEIFVEKRTRAKTR